MFNIKSYNFASKLLTNFENLNLLIYTNSEVLHISVFLRKCDIKYISTTL